MTQIRCPDVEAQINASKLRIERLAKLLADEMSRLHGFDYRIAIQHDHCCQFVLIAMKG